MTSFAMVLPYRRTSPLYVPHRDLVLGSADSLLLEVSVIEYDNPAAQLLDLTADSTASPNLKMLVWPDWHPHGSWGSGWDYGAPYYGSLAARLLWSGVGAASQVTPGTFIVSFPTATMASWPRRCRWALQLDWNDGAHTELLAEGGLHLTRSMPIAGDSGVGVGPGGGNGGTTPPPEGTIVVMATDATVPVLTDDGQTYILIQ